MKPLCQLFVLAAVLCAACDPETEAITQVQVVVRSDLEIGTQLKSLKLELLDADGEKLVHGGQSIPLVKRNPDDGEQTLPLSFGIVPAKGDASIRFLLKVRGYGPLEEGGRDEEIVRESVLTGFLPGETSVIYVFLGSQCLQQLCDSEGGGSLMSCDYQTGMCDDVDFMPPVRAPQGPTVDPVEVGCMPGFTLKNGDCIDIDECEVESDDEPPCGNEAGCENHAGGYRCWCNSNGYVEPDMDCTLDEETVDVCDPSPCDDPATCEEVDGDFVCDCGSGYEDNDPGTETCTDLDECELGTDACDVLSTCRNTTGSYVCEGCPDGYMDPEPGDTACIEIGDNECELGTDDCDPLSMCRDTTDGYVCEDCPDGYDDPAAGETECENIDECELDIDDCDPGLTCMDTMGSFQCTGCEAGFVDPMPGDTSCVNVDECELNTDGCDAVATCEDTEGSFQCECPDEYEDPAPGETGCLLIEDDCVVRVSSLNGSDADDGSTWALAKATIDAALAVPDVCQVWVAAGVYKPVRDATGAIPTDAREVTFALKPSVAVYGGFIGTETDHKQGDVLANPTILSGNIGAAGSSDNAYHIVTGAAGATLGNFFIMSGMANGTSPNNQGGGMINNGLAEITMEDLVFVDNRANFGGGVANRLATVFTVDNTVFLWNHANNAGAGLSASTIVSPTEFTNGTVTSTTFFGNTGNFGVGLWTNQSLVHIRNSTFNSNATNPTASSGALDFAAIPAGTTTEHSLINSTFINNTGVKGAAVWVDSNSPDIIGCSFINNTSDTSACVATRELAPVAQPKLLNCLFWNNTRTSGAQIDVSAEEGGAPFVDSSCGRQTLDDLGAGNANVLLGASPSPLTTIVPSGLAFLNQSTTAPTCIDAASSIHAADAAIEWSSLTTANTGALDETAPDAGRHVSPNAVAITAISANATTLTWTATNAASCAWIRRDDYIPHAVLPGAGSAAHGNAPSGTRIALMCRGDEGEPAVAAATVP